MSNKKPFEKTFPYLSYRWKYDDGEYSPFAPFTEVQFAAIESPSDAERLKNGFNIFMTNNLESIIITNIPIGREDVVAVDILYTESISSTIYVLKTIEIDVKDRGKTALGDIIINRRSFGAALPADQLSRHFDNVPRKAKAQEFTANRIIYGNYLQKFNQGKNDLGGSGLIIEPEIGYKSTPVSGPSVKTNRSYEIGVVYIDPFGRQGGLLTQKVPNSDFGGSSLIKTDFTYDSRICLKACIKSEPPEWAKYYRYFIKDISNTAFNLTAFHSYSDGEGDENVNCYVQFDSKDRNKITEDSFLLLRRETHRKNDVGGVVMNKVARLPVLAIEDEAPDIVKSQVLERFSASIVRITDGAADIVLNFGGGAANAITSVTQDIFIRSADNTDFATLGVLSALNTYFSAQGVAANALFELDDSGSTTAEISIDCTNFAEKLAIKLESKEISTNSVIGESKKVLVDTIVFGKATGDKQRTTIKLVTSNQINDDDQVVSTLGLGNTLASGVSGGAFDLDPNNNNVKQSVVFYKRGLSEEGEKKLKGSFFVKIPKRLPDMDPLDPNNRIFNIPIGQTSFDDEGNVKILQLIDFETEPADESNLDIYWEGSDTFLISEDDDTNEHGLVNQIPWSNCIATVGGSTNEIYRESVTILDKFNATTLVKGIRVNTPLPFYAEERRKAGLIFSGLYNSRTGINRLNNFSEADGITKELEPNYGGIQKLYALDTNLLTLAEDKVFKVLADKDALFNADEGVNVTATRLVLGQAMAYQGNYGISTHPESFVYFRNNVYFSDAKRGSIIQLTPANGQMFPISSKGMSNFFRDRLRTTDNIIGAYDGHKKIYVVSLQGYDHTDASIGSESIPNETSNITLAYSLNSQGWTSRYSFIPETGVSINNKFYTFKNGKVYLHHSNTANRNNFYGVAGHSEVQIIFNDNPSFVSDWLALNYEGTAGWTASEIIGEQDSTYSITNVRLLDSEDSNFDGWFLKEGKYYGSIVGTQPVYIIQPGSSIGSDGFYPLIQDGSNTQDISGTKGFFLKARFKNTSTSVCELAAVGSEYYISQT